MRVGNGLSSSPSTSHTDDCAGCRRTTPKQSEPHSLTTDNVHYVIWTIVGFTHDTTFQSAPVVTLDGQALSKYGPTSLSPAVSAVVFKADLTGDSRAMKSAQDSGPVPPPPWTLDELRTSPICSQIRPMSWARQR